MLISASGGEGNGLGSVVCGFELFDECISFARNIGEEIPWRENSLASKFSGEEISRRGNSLARKSSGEEMPWRGNSLAREIPWREDS